MPNLSVAPRGRQDICAFVTLSRSSLERGTTGKFPWVDPLRVCEGRDWVLPRLQEIARQVDTDLGVAAQSLDEAKEQDLHGQPGHHTLKISLLPETYISFMSLNFSISAFSSGL